jgi:hypothetical protein
MKTSAVVYLWLLIITPSSEREFMIPFTARTIEQAEKACNQARIGTIIMHGKAYEFSAGCVTK